MLVKFSFQILSRPPVEREPEHGRRADPQAHRQRCPALLHRRRGLCRVPLRVSHFCSVSELQPEIRMASGHGTQ